MNKTLLKYKIGLLVLFLLAVGITVVVLVQAGATKQDTATYNTANSIADKLNTYIDDNQIVPDNLSQAGIKNVPGSISYASLSDVSYKFCVTYKDNSSGFDAAGTATDLVTGALNTEIGNPGGVADNSDLYISPTYHKGANCQTIQTTVVTPDITNTPTSTSTPTSPSSSAESSASTKPLCAFSATTADSVCTMRCKAPVQSTASLIIGGLITSISNPDNSNMTFVVKDTNDLFHTASITNSTNFFDSSCTYQSAENLAVGDEVRVIVDSSVVHPGAANPNVVATEVDDFSD